MWRHASFWDAWCTASEMQLWAMLVFYFRDKSRFVWQGSLYGIDEVALQRWCDDEAIRFSLAAARSASLVLIWADFAALPSISALTEFGRAFPFRLPLLTIAEDALATQMLVQWKAYKVKAIFEHHIVFVLQFYSFSHSVFCFSSSSLVRQWCTCTITSLSCSLRLVSRYLCRSTLHPLKHNITPILFSHDQQRMCSHTGPIRTKRCCQSRPKEPRSTCTSRYRSRIYSQDLRCKVLDHESLLWR